MPRRTEPKPDQQGRIYFPATGCDYPV